MREAVARALFDGGPHALAPAEEWTEESIDWSDRALQSRRRRFSPNEGWRWLQGEQTIEGRLIGGCADVLEFLKGTAWWPEPGLWRGAILVLETSEEAPSPEQVGYWLRNYGMQGILSDLAGLLLARPMRYDQPTKERLYEVVKMILSEFGRADMPVVANMDVGHTSPMAILPLGCTARIDPVARSIDVVEACLAD